MGPRVYTSGVGCPATGRRSVELIESDSWGEDDGGSGSEAHQGSLNEVWYNTECQGTILRTKPVPCDQSQGRSQEKERLKT